MLVTRGIRDNRDLGSQGLWRSIDSYQIYTTTTLNKCCAISPGVGRFDTQLSHKSRPSIDIGNSTRSTLNKISKTSATPPTSAIRKRLVASRTQAEPRRAKRSMQSGDTSTHDLGALCSRVSHVLRRCTAKENSGELRNRPSGMRCEPMNTESGRHRGELAIFQGAGPDAFSSRGRAPPRSAIHNRATSCR